MSALILPVLKTREYDLWSMRMEQYLTFTDHALWEVIVNGDLVSPVASASTGAEGPIPPKTAKQKLARKNELKAKNTLMLAILDENLLKFHACVYEWSFQADEKNHNFALMTYTSQGSSSSSSSDSEREALNKSNLEIIGFQMRLESLEARIVVHEKNEAVYEENIAFLKYDVQVKDISIKDLKNQLEEALKEKDDLKLKLEKFEESSKNLTKLINIQISAKDKCLGYDSQMNEIELNNIYINESEVVHSVFNSRESDVDDSPINDRFKTGEGFHAVPPPYTRNYIPPRPDLSFVGLDESIFQSAVRKTTTSVPETETSISKTSKDIPRDNRRNWNGMMTQKLGNGFEL
ncbi:hypothetical protein Tco_1516761 [Tanacetum coccineum]